MNIGRQDKGSESIRYEKKESESGNFDKFLDCRWYLGERRFALLGNQRISRPEENSETGRSKK